MLGGILKFTILGEPVGKPRMTQRDKWAERPAVMHYRAWADRARAAAPNRPGDAKDVSWVAYFDLPASYSKKKRAALAGQPHRQKPDRDNVDKAVLDALFAQDCTVSDGTLRKRWDDGRGPRIEITITT
jgi:Holliday junction resolvase RusA-like endonuclease